MAPYEAVGCSSENSEAQNQSAHFITYTHTHTHSTQRYVMQILLPSSVTPINCSLATTLFNADLHTYHIQDKFHWFTSKNTFIHCIHSLFENDTHKDRWSCVLLISVVFSADLSTFPTWPLSIWSQMSRILTSNSVMGKRGALTLQNLIKGTTTVKIQLTFSF